MASVRDEVEMDLETAKLRPPSSRAEERWRRSSDTHTAACCFPGCAHPCHRCRWVATTCAATVVR
jgi:hypothetical protein